MSAPYVIRTDWDTRYDCDWDSEPFDDDCTYHPYQIDPWELILEPKVGGYTAKALYAHHRRFDEFVANAKDRLRSELKPEMRERLVQDIVIATEKAEKTYEDVLRHPDGLNLLFAGCTAAELPEKVQFICRDRNTWLFSHPESRVERLPKRGNPPVAGSKWRKPTFDQIMLLRRLAIAEKGEMEIDLKHHSSSVRDDIRALEPIGLVQFLSHRTRYGHLPTLVQVRITDIGIREARREMPHPRMSQRQCDILSETKEGTHVSFPNGPMWKSEPLPEHVPGVLWIEYYEYSREGIARRLEARGLLEKFVHTVNPRRRYKHFRLTEEGERVFETHFHNPIFREIDIDDSEN